MRRPTRRRAGLAALLMILVLPGLFLFIVLVLSIDRASLTGAELRNAGVSAALAGAGELATDDLLTTDPNRIRPLAAKARTKAQELAGRHRADGKAVTLADADVVFGITGRSFGGTFAAFNPQTAPPADNGWKTLNAVEVTVRAGTGRSTRVEALFDTAVTGFRPTANRPIPLAPFALFDTQTPPAGWTAVVAAGRAAAPLELAKVVVVIGQPSQPSDLVPAVLNIGASNPAETLAQIGSGITTANLADPTAFGGAFALDPTTMTKSVPGAVGSLNNNLDAVAAAFSPLVNRAWVWPLFSTTGVDASGTPTVTVAGFVAARLLAVTTVKVTDPMTMQSRTTAVRLTLQEAVLATPTAVTQPAPRAGLRPPPVQRSVGKVRLAG